MTLAVDPDNQQHPKPEQPQQCQIDPRPTGGRRATMRDPAPLLTSLVFGLAAQPRHRRSPPLTGRGTDIGMGRAGRGTHCFLHGSNSFRWQVQRGRATTDRLAIRRFRAGSQIFLRQFAALFGQDARDPDSPRPRQIGVERHGNKLAPPPEIAQIVIVTAQKMPGLPGRGDED